MSLSLSLSVSVSLSLSLCLSLCPSLSPPASVSLSPCSLLPGCLWLLCLCLYKREETPHIEGSSQKSLIGRPQSLSLSVSLPVSLSVCLSLCLSLLPVAWLSLVALSLSLQERGDSPYRRKLTEEPHWEAAVSLSLCLSLSVSLPSLQSLSLSLSLSLCLSLSPCSLLPGCLWLLCLCRYRREKTPHIEGSSQKSLIRRPQSLSLSLSVCLSPCLPGGRESRRAKEVGEIE